MSQICGNCFMDYMSHAQDNLCTVDGISGRRVPETRWNPILGDPLATLRTRLKSAEKERDELIHKDMMGAWGEIQGLSSQLETAQAEALRYREALERISSLDYHMDGECDDHEKCPAHIAHRAIIATQALTTPAEEKGCLRCGHSMDDHSDKRMCPMPDGDGFHPEWCFIPTPPEGGADE